MNRAQGVASTPYEGFGGEQVAPVNQQQQAGIGNINTQQGVIAGTGAPISAADIQRYQDPYTNQVIQATQADFDAQNARAQSQTTGNAAAQGALGGDRSAVAAALTAEGQSRSQAPVIAGLRSQGYQQAVKTAEDQQQQALRAGVAGLQGAQAQVGAGTLQQQTQQAQDTQNRQDYYQKQGYPFQVAQWLAQMETGVGSQMGGTGTNTGTSTTQGPEPNQWAQLAGAGLTAAAMFSDRDVKENIQKIGTTNDGQPIYRFNYRGHPTTTIGMMHDEVERSHPEATGRVGGVGVVDYHKATEDAVEKFRGGRISGVNGFAAGGMPWAGSETWVPQVSGITAGRGAPSAPSLPSAPGAPKQSGLSADQMKGIGAIGKGLSGLDYGGMSGAMDGGDPMSGDAWGGGSFAKGSAWGGSGVNPLPGLSADDYGLDYDRGGRVRGYASGGGPDDDPTFDDRFGASFPRSSAGVGAAQPAFADEPFRMLDRPTEDAEPPALENWRSGVKRDIRLGQTEQTDEPSGSTALASSALPPEVISGRSKPPMMARSEPQEADEGPSTALGYAGVAPRPSRVIASNAPPEASRDMNPVPDEGFLSRMGIRMTPELKQGLLQAGLSMMATRHGGAGSFLSAAGEAGMTGVGAYNQTQQNALEQANKEAKEGFEREKFESPYSRKTLAQQETERHNKALEAKERADRVPSGYRIGKDGNLEYIKGGPEDPDRIKEKEGAKKNSEGGLSDAGVEVSARQAAMGDQSWAKNIGRGAQSGKDVTKVRNRLSDILINEQGKSPQEAARFVAEASREWAASQIAANAGARTRANRVANLEMILEVADSAVPAAIEMSKKVNRIGGQWKPLNEFIQKGQVITSDPDLNDFGIANLQLAEGWAKAMNPTGVMRESDRDLALKYLSTATSHDTYERAVKQIQKQIQREMSAINKGHSPKENSKTVGEVPSPTAIERLNSDPAKYRKDFEEKYKTSADRFLG